MSDWLITTNREQCRMCYTCVRECPAKAIKIVEGQAEIISQRCITCGNCVRVCSQRAKSIRDGVSQVWPLIASDAPVAALVAPSFPAEFPELSEEELVGRLRAAGFDFVFEVAFGADMVARRYQRLLNEDQAGRYIAANCPAVVGLIERYYPDLVNRLAPIVSPMVALARYVRRLHGEHVKCVFIGPCIGKRAEAWCDELAMEVNHALTFDELRRWLAATGADKGDSRPSDFDPPRGGMGGLYPVSGGAMQAAGISEDLLGGEVLSTQGREEVVEAIREMRSGDLGVRLLEALCCEGCIMGPGFTDEAPMFRRRERVREQVARRMSDFDGAAWAAALDSTDDLDLSRRFSVRDQRAPDPDEATITRILKRMGKGKPEDELNCGACGYDTCREHASAVHRGLAETEMCLPHMVGRLRSAVEQLQHSHRELSTTQNALMQSEKLARMGQMAAGIAHEINNPLGVILMYSHLMMDEADGHPFGDDVRMIVDQANRCKAIVGGLLDFARHHEVNRQTVDIREVIDMAVRCAFIPERIDMETRIDESDPSVDLDQDQMVNVFSNLLTNAVDAIEGEGRIAVGIAGDEREIRVSVTDSGAGIQPEDMASIFEPFFTTKESGHGTGLGLAVIEQTIKMHNGSVDVKSNADPERGPTGTTFTVSLPRADYK